MANPHCFASLQTVAFRVGALAPNGSPLTGAGNGYVSDALIEMSLGVEVEDGDEFVVKNAAGNICTIFRDCDKLKNLTFETQLCHLDAELLSLMVGGSLFTALEAGPAQGDTIGWQFPSVSAQCPDGLSLELWTKAWDGGTQATPPYLGSAAAFFHWVFPATKWTIGNLNFQNDTMTVTVSGIGEENHQITADGPFDDWPSDVANAGGITNLGGFFLTDEVPDVECGFIPVPSDAS